jgi:hypothetical protein
MIITNDENYLIVDLDENEKIILDISLRSDWNI